MATTNFFDSYFFFHKLLNGRDLTLQERLARESLLNFPTYRLPESSKHDKLIGFKVLYRTTKRILKSSNACRKFGKNSCCILDGGFRFYEVDTEYISKVAPQYSGWFIAKEDILGNGSMMVRITNMLLTIAFYSPLALKCFFNSKRKNIALIISEALEANLLLRVLKKLEINLVVDYLNYEKDSNALYLYLQKNEIKVIKFPSPGPLMTHNRILLSDELSLSAHYQFEEYEKLKNQSILVEKVNKWPPENAMTYINKYINEEKKAPLNTLGYYSHGSWLRKEEGHSDDGLDLYSQEKRLLLDLSQFLQKNKEYQLTIYLHPKEKRKELQQEMESFYKIQLKGVNFSLFKDNIKTSDVFSQVDVALAAFSTVIYERLFCGYKTLIGNYGKSEFPIPESTLNNICFGNFTELSEQVEKISKLDNDGFFKKNKLEGYKYDTYPFFKN